MLIIVLVSAVEQMSLEITQSINRNETEDGGQNGGVTEKLETEQNRPITLIFVINCLMCAAKYRPFYSVMVCR